MRLNTKMNVNASSYLKMGQLEWDNVIKNVRRRGLVNDTICMCSCLPKIHKRGVATLTSTLGPVNLLPTSNGSRYYEPFKTKIAIIADEDLFNFYRDTAQLFYMTPSNWKEFVENVDVLLITNVKLGLNYEWLEVKKAHSEQRMILFKMIKLYRAHGVKIVFYTREAPGDYQGFLEIAKLCDYIFTASAQKKVDYQVSCENEKVYLQKFGINAVDHHPIGFKKGFRISGAAFSSSWNKRFAEKVKETEMIFDGIVEADHELHILDTYANLQNTNYTFTDRHHSHIYPNISDKFHKLFDWVVNINTLSHSESMFSDQIYALQGSGNIVLSNYNEGINNLFPHVFTILDKEEVDSIMNTFDTEELYEHQILGIRQVMSHETNHQRMYEMLKTIGLDIKNPIKTVAVIVKEETDHMLECYQRQTYEDKSLILEKNSSDATLKNYDFIAYFSDEVDYGMYYLEDMINAFKYTDVDFVTKKAYLLNGQLQEGTEHDYVNDYEDKARTVFSTQGYHLLSDLNHQVGNGYAIDHFEFSMGSAETTLNEPLYKLSVIIPVFNNGERLRGKAFNSLRRSAMFQEMEIIIVDDGSTDERTVSIVKKLANKYNNVKTHFYPSGGSGSASRPRNKGVKLSTADYITYLDPDDEMFNDGFKKLYEEIAHHAYSMVVGNARLITHKKVHKVDYYKSAKKVNHHSSIILDTNEFLVKMKLRPMYLMSLIVRKNIILENNLNMIEGAFGEDSLFYQELVLNSEKIKLVNEEIFLYYRTIEGSATNQVSATLFERYLLREQAAKEKYKMYQVLEAYLALRYEQFFKKWYFSKLKRISEGEWIAAIKALKAMIDLHASYHELKDEQMIRFYDLAIKEEYEILKKVDVLDENNSTVVAQKHLLKTSFEEITPAFLSQLEEQIKKIPTSNGSRYYDAFKVKIGLIADAYLYEHVKNGATFMYITPSNYKDHLGKIDVFLITNAQIGLDGEWTDMVNPKSNQRLVLKQMMMEFRAAGAKIIYCATEDPSKEKILEGLAKQVDYIFTSSAQKIAEYKKRCKNNQVYHLTWGIDPEVHHPIGCKSSVKYSGAIFSRSKHEAFPQLTDKMKKVFDGVIKAEDGLTIMDQGIKVAGQQFDSKKSQELFPQKYWQYLLSGIEEKCFLSMHKLYDWAININYEMDSQTIANSVYELQAIGNLVLSNDSPVMNSMFPHIFIIEKQSQVKNMMSKLSDEEKYRHQMIGVRNVMSRHTHYHYLYDILCTIGIEVEPPIKKIAVIIQDNDDRMKKMYHIQTYQEKEWLLMRDLSDETLREYDFITYFSNDAIYGSHYLEDMINAFKYTDVDFITKQAYVMDGQLVSGVEHDYVNHYEDKARTVFSTRNYQSLKELDHPMGEGYAIDHFEFEVTSIKPEVR